MKLSMLKNLAALVCTFLSKKGCKIALDDSILSVVKCNSGASFLLPVDVEMVEIP